MGCSWINSVMQRYLQSLQALLLIVRFTFLPRGTVFCNLAEEGLKHEFEKGGRRRPCIAETNLGSCMVGRSSLSSPEAILEVINCNVI